LPRHEKARCPYLALNSLFVSESNSSLSMYGSTDWNSGIGVVEISLLCGHTSWHTSQPNTRGVLAMICSSSEVSSPFFWVK
jgi:hypothetical protein